MGEPSPYQMFRDTAPPTKPGAQDNPAPPEEGYVAGFVGTGIEVAIAKWYYARSWEVFPIQRPAGNPDFPWRFDVHRFDESTGKELWAPVGLVAEDLPNSKELIAVTKREAETVNGGERGELWLTRYLGESKYEAARWILLPRSTRGNRWHKENTEVFSVGH